MRRKNWWFIAGVIFAILVGATMYACGSSDDDDSEGTEGEGTEDTGTEGEGEEAEGEGEGTTDAGASDSGGQIKCDDPTAKPPLCLKKGDENPGDVVDQLTGCQQKEEVYKDMICTQKACEIYDQIWDAKEGCSHSTPDPDMCNCLDCYYKEIACLVWADKYEQCADLTAVTEECVSERETCINNSGYARDKCDAILTYQVNDGNTQP